MDWLMGCKYPCTQYVSVNESQCRCLCRGSNTEKQGTLSKIITRQVPVQRAVERDEIPYPYKVHDTTLHSRA